MKKVLSKMKGSILAYTLILLFVVLTASLGMFASSLKDLRSSGTQGRSTQAFNVASSGSEMAVAAIKKTSGHLDDLANQIGGGASCNGGEITKSPYLGGEARLTFLDGDGNKIGDCATTDISKIASVKSVGTFKETARAIEVAVAADCSESEGILVAESPDETYDANDINDIKNFMAVKGHVFSGFFCEREDLAMPGRKIIQIAGQGAYASFQKFSDQVDIVSDFGYFLQCKGNECLSGAKCTDGWAIYGSCVL